MNLHKKTNNGYFIKKDKSKFFETIISRNFHFSFSHLGCLPWIIDKRNTRKIIGGNRFPCRNSVLLLTEARPITELKKKKKKVSYNAIHLILDADK